MSLAPAVDNSARTTNAGNSQTDATSATQSNGSSDTNGKGSIDAKTFNLNLPEGHKGSITIGDNAPIESIILAYRAIRNLSRHIAKRVLTIDQTNPQPIVLLHNPAEFVSLNDLNAFVAIIGDFERRFESLKKANDLLASGVSPDLQTILPVAIPAFAVLSGLLNSGLQLFSLFRSDQEIKNYKIDFEDQVLAVTVAGQLALLPEKKFKVYSSAIVPATPTNPSKVLSDLGKLDKLRSELSKILGDTTQAANGGSPLLSSLSGLIPELDAGNHNSSVEQAGVGISESRSSEDRVSDQSSDGSSSEDSQVRSQELSEEQQKSLGPRRSSPARPHSSSKELSAHIKKALEDFDSFKESLSKVDDKQASTRLSRILAAESLRSLLAAGAHIVWVKAVAAGGMAHTKTSTVHGELTFGSGVVVSYAIFNKDGEIEEADTVPLYAGKVTVDHLPPVTLGLELYGGLTPLDSTKELPGELKYALPPPPHHWWLPGT
jgi:hypothetical protein